MPAITRAKQEDSILYKSNLPERDGTHTTQGFSASVTTNWHDENRIHVAGSS